MHEDEHFLGTKIFPNRASLKSLLLSLSYLQITEFDLLGLDLLLYIFFGLSVAFKCLT